MFRLRSLSLPGVALALTASCSSSTTGTPTPPTADPDPQPTHPQTGSELAAVKLGVTIDARDERGVPRLIRAIVPRAGAKGMTVDQTARDHLAALAPLWLTHQQAADLTTQGVQTLRNGASIVRLQQRIDGIPFHQSELRVMVNADGSLAAVSGTVLPNAGRTTFTSTPAIAVDRALDALYGKTRVRPAVTEAGTAADSEYTRVTVASNAGFRVQSARAKREMLTDGGQPLPGWVVELQASKTGFDDRIESSARRVLVTDDGRVLHNINLTANDAFVYRALAETTGNRTPFDGALLSYTPHPTGTPDGSVPDFGPYNLVVQEAFNATHDPWLPNNATTTTGNNVDAYADISPPEGFSPGDIRPDVRAGRTLNHKYDFTAEPLSSVTQSKAAAVNVFFVTNWLHDWYYDSGFTELTGNAQSDNLSRGGVGGDPLVAHAQANALGGSRDNANMTTPDDGESPTMNMFLWSGGSVSSLTAGAASPVTDVFVNGPKTFDLDGTVVLANDTTGGRHTGCVPIGDVTGKIALIEFDGTCGSIVAVANVAAAGAIGVIAMIDVEGAPTQPLNGNADANIPGLVIGFDDGRALEATLPAVVSLHRVTQLEHDGDFDNAIIAHEWGHYLHHRLASCELTNQCTAMSEGWGDFNALLMMLRPTDDRDGTFGTGLYALTAGGLTSSGFLDPGYFGIRRFPYSTNRAKNGLSLRHIGDDNALPDLPSNPGPVSNGNSEVHNAGEIWAEQLWEVYNVLIDEHGVVESHRRMSDYVVAGLLLTPPEATYLEARDAILAAAGAIDTDDMILMAAAFAGRGSGTCAVAPARESFDFTGVVESGTIAARLETSIATLTDDGVSCDHDGYLDPGESGTIHLTLSNSGIIAAESVVITPTTTSAGVTLGKPINVASIAPLTHIDIAIPVKIALNAPVNSNLDIAIAIKGDAGCNTRNLALAIHQRMGVDEAAAVATSDNIETKILAWTPTGTPNLWNRVEGVAGNHVLFGTDAGFTSDTQLVSPVLQASPTAPLVVSVKHAYDLEAFAVFGFFFDGGVIEVSNDGGASWRDVTEVGVNPMYPATISTDFDNPLAGRDAFSGTNPAFPALEPLVLNFGTQFAGQAVQIRFRIGSDFCCTATGWAIDDISVTGVTNTPFPGFVPEPTRCTVGTAAREADEESGVTDVRHMPRASLRSFPAIEQQL